MQAPQVTTKRPTAEPRQESRDKPRNRVTVDEALVGSELLGDVYPRTSVPAHAVTLDAVGTAL